MKIDSGPLGQSVLNRLIWKEDADVLIRPSSDLLTFLEIDRKHQVK